ncbi:MAG TPA: FkbM family methyltransferase [Candidatus Limnocylindria bacterium]|nr:FkbM family methyltransferase [Candidatus Limnocylindria bacterium]
MARSLLSLARGALRRTLRRGRAPATRDLRRPWLIKQGPATVEDIFYCFRLLLGRPPNREEWGGHAAQAGEELDTVVRSYLGSLEFARRAEALAAHQLGDRVTLVRSSGFSIYVPEDDVAVGQHVKRDAYEPNVTAVFRDRLRPGMHVLDVGANIGYYTMLSAALVGPSGSVTAIEPNPSCIKLLEASRRANGFAHVTVLQVAAGRDRGLLVLHGSHSNAMTSAPPDDAGALIRSRTVPSFRIDDLVPADRKIDFVKIDVEGAEHNALSGAVGLIRRCHPTIVSEFSPYTMPGISGVDGRQYLRFLLELGYSMWVIGDGGALRSCGTDPEKVMAAFDESGVDHIDILLD